LKAALVGVVNFERLGGGANGGENGVKNQCVRGKGKVGFGEQNLLIARAERAPKKQTEQNRKSVEIAHRKTTHKTKEYWWFSSILGKNVL
jgi:hypothetical protein